eukprot:4374918-Pleurochrysis_carterae.AAC.1
MMWTVTLPLTLWPMQQSGADCLVLARPRQLAGRVLDRRHGGEGARRGAETHLPRAARAKGGGGARRGSSCAELRQLLEGQPAERDEPLLPRDARAALRLAVRCGAGMLPRSCP